MASVASATLGQARVGIYIIDWAPKTTIDTRSHLSNHPVSPNIALSDSIFGVCFRHCNLFSGMRAPLSNFFVHYYQPKMKINYCISLGSYLMYIVPDRYMWWKMWNRVKTETFQKVQKKFNLDLVLGFRTKLSMSRIPYEGAPVSQTPAVSLFFQIATISSFSFNNVNHFYRTRVQSLAMLVTHSLTHSLTAV